MNIPSEQNAAVKQGFGKDTTVPVTGVPVNQDLLPNQILVKINWTGLCASDRSFIYDELAPFGVALKPATHGISGHEGAGTVLTAHPSVSHLWKPGDRAGIKWVASICGSCEYCTNGRDELHCPSQLNSGLSTPGTFQEYCVTDGRYATRIPEGVSDEQAGPIMCGGVTAYVGCKRSGVMAGQWVVIMGAGGGLGHFGVQYARAMGMRVIAVDAGDDKAALCRELGAEVFIDFKKVQDLAKEVMRTTTYGAHGVVVYAASKAGYAAAPELLRVGGTVVAVGLPHDPDAVAGAHPMLLATKRLNVVGSVTGTLKEVQEALDFTARGIVKPILTKGTLADVDKFCKMLGEGTLPGRAVMKVSE